MASIEVGQVERLMRDVTLGTIRAMEYRREQSEIEGLREREAQFQVSISGRGEEFPSWTSVELEFETLFIDGRGQRDSELERPQFTYGVYVPRGGPVGVLACVTSWKLSDRNETIGATVGLGAVSTDVARKFSGQVHLTFQGFGCPADVYGDPLQNDEG